jgi:predicted transposase YbfD/YdcC
MSALANVAEEVLARDGQTIRRALARADGTGAMHVVSAWASRHELVLAQLKVDDKSHEITALPELLALLKLHGRVVTIAAMGGQVEIARQIVDQGGDDVLSWKANQPGLHRACEELFAWRRGPPPKDQAVVLGDDAPVDGGQGRIETRTVWSTEALEGLRAGERWPGLTTLVLVESTRQVAAPERMERRSYISALPGTTDQEAKRWSGVMRTHGEIETRVHWVLDVAMGEDANRTRAGESAQNLALIRKLALQLLRRETSVPVGIAAKQKRAGWDHHDLVKILAQT